MLKKICLTLLVPFVLQSCTVVKEYEKEKIRNIKKKLQMRLSFFSGSNIYFAWFNYIFNNFERILLE